MTDPLLSDICLITVVKDNLDGLKQTCMSYSNNRSYEHGKRISYLFLDGNSSDGSFEFLRGWAATYGHILNINLLQLPPKGVYDAMNHAIRLSTSKWVMFINSGDILCCPVDNLLNLVDNSSISITHITGKCGLFFTAYPKHCFVSNAKASSKPHQATLYKRVLHYQYSFYDTKYVTAADIIFLSQIKKKNN